MSKGNEIEPSVGRAMEAVASSDVPDRSVSARQAEVCVSVGSVEVCASYRSMHIEPSDVTEKHESRR